MKRILSFLLFTASIQALLTCVALAQTPSTRTVPQNEVNTETPADTAQPAEEVSATTTQNACGTSNLAKGVTITKKKGVSNMARVTDGRAAAEGSTWNGKASSIFKNTESYVIFDLGSAQKITAMTLQGDNNDTYAVETSTD